jgi:hypothetical protein
MQRGLRRAAVFVVAAAVFAVGVTACGSTSLSGERKSLAERVEAVPRPDSIVLLPCDEVDFFTTPKGKVSLLASCFSTSKGSGTGDVRGFINDVVTAVGGSKAQAWTCQNWGVGRVICSAIVAASGDAPSGARINVQIRSDVTPVSLPESFQGVVDIGVAVLQKK